MRPRIKTKALCATSTLGNTRVRLLSDEAPIRKKTLEDKERELRAKMRKVMHSEKYAVKEGRIFIMTHYGKGMLGQGVLC